MSPQQPRRPSSSRVTTSRPRKIAGRDSEPLERAAPEPAPGKEKPVKTAKPDSAAKPESAPDAAEKRPLMEMFAGTRLTRVLLISLAVLIVLMLAQGGWFLRHRHLENQTAAAAKQDTGGIDVPPGRPIVLDQTDVDAAVDAAAKDAVVIVSRSYKNYDASVEKAVDLMTDSFATQFKQSAAATKPQFIAKKVDVSVKVMDQGAVRASATKVQALIFLDQYITRGTGKNERITTTPYKMTVTMVHTDHGWLVENLDTK
ncbi:MAG: DUF4607 domain-containing protein [Nocardioidaceae bacterium]|nr:DUF4607 domain-containing protein [Nocardioidaceae bacterium]MCL2611772.1 DUF4607 domain-containing protein [Nocardioidaceae bacterium]